MQRLADRVSAVFVPVVLALAAATLGRLADRRRRAGHRVHRRRRGADHRLPVRARPRDADRAAGRHGPRRAARHPDQGSAGARVHPPGGHGRAGQDRHRHDGPDAARRRGPGRRVRRDASCCGWPALEDASEHPIGAAVAAGARERLGALPAVRDFRSLQGLGVRGVVDGHDAVAGRPAWLAREWDLPLPAALAQAATPRRPPGSTVVGVGWDGAVRGLLVVADTVKPTSAQAISELRGLGLRPVLLTGDNAAAAAAVAAPVGIAPGDVHRRGAARRQGRRRRRSAGRGPRWSRWSATA